jgi:hypothetical protein
MDMTNTPTRASKVLIKDRSRNLSSASTLQFDEDDGRAAPKPIKPRAENPKNSSTKPRTPPDLIEAANSDARSRALAPKVPTSVEQRGNPKTARGPPMPDVLGGIKPRFVSIKFAAAFTSQCEWSIKMLLREGVLQGCKSGRRTLIRFESLEL